MNMTKAEALAAMREGKKVTHRWFSRDEWMTMESGQIVLEDGVRCSQSFFWMNRTDASWNDGYSIFES
jgi:hypothetical protein